jgi:hypothetical protein
MKYTIEQIDEAIKRASKIYAGRPLTNYMVGKLSTLKDLRNRAANEDKDLSPRQIDYLNSLMNNFSKEELDKQANWVTEWRTNQDLRERADIVSKYYIAQRGWFMDIARKVCDHLNGMGSKEYVPDFHMFHRMILNEYAEKVWKSHKSAHRWKAGELVCCRSGAKFDGWTYQIRAEGININKDPCMVIESGSKPISNAAKHDEKRGGCRWVSVNPIGTTYIFHVMEKDLKTYRQPKKRSKK